MFCLIVSGCDESPKEPNYDEVHVTIRLVDSIENNPSTYGISHCVNNRCLIEIRKDVYPLCVTHEVRHAFEGNWHEGIETTEGCDVGE